MLVRIQQRNNAFRHPGGYYQLIPRQDDLNLQRRAELSRFRSCITSYRCIIQPPGNHASFILYAKTIAM